MTEHVNVEVLRGAPVVDSRGVRIGAVGDVYLDDASGEAAWATIKSGLFRRRTWFVPLVGASFDGSLRLPFTGRRRRGPRCPGGRAPLQRGGGRAVRPLRARSGDARARGRLRAGPPHRPRRAPAPRRAGRGGGRLDATAPIRCVTARTRAMRPRRRSSTYPDLEAHDHRLAAQGHAPQVQWAGVRYEASSRRVRWLAGVRVEAGRTDRRGPCSAASSGTRCDDPRSGLGYRPRAASGSGSRRRPLS